MRYRDHVGDFEASMATQVTVKDWDAMVAHIRGKLVDWGIEVEPGMVHCRTYAGGLPDPRCGWEHTFVVTIDHYGVVGFADANLEPPTPSQKELYITQKIVVEYSNKQKVKYFCRHQIEAERLMKVLRESPEILSVEREAQ